MMLLLVILIIHGTYCVVFGLEKHIWSTYELFSYVYWLFKKETSWLQGDYMLVLLFELLVLLRLVTIAVLAVTTAAIRGYYCYIFEFLLPLKILLLLEL